MINDVWISKLTVNPLPNLLNSNNQLIIYFAERDLLEKAVKPIETIWNLPEAQKILKKQQPDGSWPDKTAKKHIGSPTDYKLVETYRNLRILIEMYGFNKDHPSIRQAAEFIFTRQTDEGDIRGIYGFQYCPNYFAGLLELLVKAGYTEDPRIDKAFQWFIKNVQTDGGWVLQVQAAGIKMADTDAVMRQPDPIQVGKKLPSAIMVTGVVIRAFANHPKYLAHSVAGKAADFLTNKFFKPDNYSSRHNVSNWTKYTFPFWWSDLLGVLDALSRMKYPVNDSKIQYALRHFIKNQRSDGSWDFSILQGKSIPDYGKWLLFILCRIFKRFYPQNQSP
jgi:hypothetical protein